jgi:hypothetical protein
VTLDLSHQNQLHEALKVRGRKVSEKAQGPRPRECLRQQRVIKAALSIREQQYIHSRGGIPIRIQAACLSAIVTIESELAV